jgi:hypothetical protein
VVNRTLLIAISAMLIVCAIYMIFSLLWVNSNGGAHYLCLTRNDLTPPYSNQGDVFQANYDPRFSDPTGRKFYLRGSYQF